MISLNSDNRQLLKGAKFSYLSTNYTSGQASLVLNNSSCAVTNKFALIGNFGSQSSEIVKITGVTTSTNTITITPSTKYAHAQDTKVTIIGYNQVKYYQTAAATFSAVENPLTKSMGDSTTEFTVSDETGNVFKYTYTGTGTDPDIDAIVEINSEVIINAQNLDAANNETFEVTGIGTDYFEVTNATGLDADTGTIGTGSIKYSINVQANRTFTVYEDTVNTTGYGFFCFYNSITKQKTSDSNAIPYGGFSENSVKDIFDAFFSQLNNKEQKLIDNSDAFRWLNEAISKIQNELNLVNQNYNIADEWTVTTVSGTQEYALPTNFSDIRSVTDSDGDLINTINIKNVPKNDADAIYSNGNVNYFLRGAYIGFSPIPTGADTYNVYYKKKSTVLNSYYDSVEIPDNNFYLIIDWMLYRASGKLDKSNAKEHFESFKIAIQNMKIISHKQNNSLDSFGISTSSNV